MQARVDSWAIKETDNLNDDLPVVDAPGLFPKSEAEKHLDALQLITRDNIVSLSSKLKRAEKQLAFAKRVLRESEAAENAAQRMRQAAQDDISASDSLIAESEQVRMQALNTLRTVEEMQVEARKQWWSYD